MKKRILVGLLLVLVVISIAQAVIIHSQSQLIDRYAEETDDRADAPLAK